MTKDPGSRSKTEGSHRMTKQRLFLRGCGKCRESYNSIWSKTRTRTPGDKDIRTSRRQEIHQVIPAPTDLWCTAPLLHHRRWQFLKSPTSRNSFNLEEQIQPRLQQAVPNYMARDSPCACKTGCVLRIMHKKLCSSRTPFHLALCVA